MKKSQIVCHFTIITQEVIETFSNKVFSFIQYKYMLAFWLIINFLKNNSWKTTKFKSHIKNNLTVQSTAHYLGTYA